MSRRARLHAPLAPLLALFGVAIGVAVAACTAGDDYLPTYGAANGLAGMSPAKSTAATGDDDDGGGSTGTGGGCVAGSTPALYIDGGTCSVSFSKDIEGLMSSATAWNCVSSSCHGGTQAPAITGTASVDYPVLAKYSLNFNRPYINPCTTDPAGSSISCNLIPDSCDDMTQMPEPIGNNMKASAAQLATLTTWLQCGAPNN